MPQSGFSMYKNKKNYEEITGKKIIEFLFLVLIGIILGLSLVNLLGITEVYGASMSPTISSEDRMLINKMSYKKEEPKRGDIIVFNSTLKDDKGNNKSLIKRVIGLPKERLTIKGGNVYINGTKIDEPYINTDYTDGNIDILIQDGEYFVMGDNRTVSRDSRDISVGTIDKEDIVGKASIRYFPFSDIGIVK